MDADEVAEGGPVMHRIRRTGTLERILSVSATVVVLTSTLAPKAMAGPGTAYFDTGRELVAEGRTELGLRHVATAVALEPDNFVAQTYFVSMLDRDPFRDDPAKLKSLTAVLPRYVPLLDRLALLYEGKKRQAEAERLYAAWAELRPASAEVHARAGEHYRFTGQDDKAIAAFTRYLEVVEESGYGVRRITESTLRKAVRTAADPAATVAVVRSP
jgi:tetratricopeptide (TPR) repeat protein